MARPNHKRALNVHKRRGNAAVKRAKKDAKAINGCFTASVGCLLAPFAVFFPKKKKKR